VLVGLLLGCAAEHAPGERLVDAARRLLVASPTPPPADAAGWTPVALPDFWGIDVRRRALEGWYRADVHLPAAPADTWALYFPRVGQNVAAWVNGVLVGDGGSFADPLPRNWNRPLLFTIPAPLLRAGDNTIAVRLITHRGAPGYLRPFHLGPLAELRPLYARRTWWQVDVTQIVGAGTLAGGLLLLAFSLRTPTFAPLGWIALALVLWAWSTADAFVQEVPVPTRLWEWSTATALVWCPVAFVLGFHRMLRWRRPRFERAIVLGAGLATGLLFAVPPLYFFTAMLAAVGLALGMGGYVVALAAWTRLGRGSRATVLVPAVVVLAVGIHDVVAASSGAAPLGVFLSPYLPLLAVGFTAWALLGQHLASVEETAALNRTLETRVAEKHAQLEANFAHLQALERERAVASERTRIMQDVHDGVGGQLVSALALAEEGRTDSSELSDVLRGALDDLRLVIDSLDPIDCDLLAVLGAARARLEPRLHRHGLQMRWEVREVPPLPDFGPERALQVMRIVQEAVTNVVKHAAARTITVRTGESADPHGHAGVCLEIRDDGCGYGPGAPQGRGLSGMAQRAARLGGRLELRSAAEGTTVRLWLPLSPA
jgi:signal transduction histidine kinase